MSQGLHRYDKANHNNNIKRTKMRSLEHKLAVVEHEVIEILQHSYNMEAIIEKQTNCRIYKTFNTLIISEGELFAKSNILVGELATMSTP